MYIEAFLFLSLSVFAQCMPVNGSSVSCVLVGIICEQYTYTHTHTGYLKARNSAML